MIKLHKKFALLYEQAKGFSQKICLFFFTANSIIFLCVVGGEEIAIASIFLSYINFFQLEYILIFFGIGSFSIFLDLKQKPFIL